MMMIENDFLKMSRSFDQCNLKFYNIQKLIISKKLIIFPHRTLCWRCQHCQRDHSAICKKDQETWQFSIRDVFENSIDECKCWTHFNSLYSLSSL